MSMLSPGILSCFESIFCASIVVQIDVSGTAHRLEAPILLTALLGLNNLR